MSDSKEPEELQLGNVPPWVEGVAKESRNRWKALGKPLFTKPPMCAAMTNPVLGDVYAKTCLNWMRFILMCDIPFNSAHILSIAVGELVLIGVMLYIKREFIPDLGKGGQNNPL